MRYLAVCRFCGELLSHGNSDNDDDQMVINLIACKPCEQAKPLSHRKQKPPWWTPTALSANRHVYVKVVFSSCERGQVKP